MTTLDKAQEVRTLTVRIPAALYEEFMSELESGCDPWFSIDVEEVDYSTDSEPATLLIRLRVRGTCAYRENRWKLFTMEV